MDYDNTDMILDSMLEACDTMLDSVEMLQEATKEQKMIKRYESDEVEKNRNRVEKLPTWYLKNVVKSNVKGYHSGLADKSIDIGANAGKKISKFFGNDVDDDTIDEIKRYYKGGMKLGTGLAGNELAKRGVNVKDLAAKAAAKGDVIKARKTGKAAAVREACEYMLAVLDSIDED